MSTLVDPHGKCHHSEELVTLKSKMASPIGTFGADYSGRHGPVLSMTHKLDSGGAMSARSLSTDKLDLSYSADTKLPDGYGSASTSLSLGMPYQSIFSPVTFGPRAIMKYAYQKNISVTLKAELDKKNEPDLTANYNFVHKFAISDTMTGQLKADLKQQIVAKNELSLGAPVAVLNARVSEKDKEYALSYNGHKNKLQFFNATYLPEKLKMNPFMNFLTPLAVGIGIEAPVDKLDNYKKWSRTAMVSYPLGPRLKTTPTMLNMSISTLSELTATVLRKEVIKSQGNNVTAVGSFSVKANLMEEFGNAEPLKSPKDSKYKGPQWGFKMELVGDVTEFPLSDSMTFW